MNKQETIIAFLNNNMQVGQMYEYSEILKWSKEHKIKEGTLSSLLTKAKGIGAILHNEKTGLRTKVHNIDYDNIKQFDKKHYNLPSNTSGITQKICNKVKALHTAKFSDDEVSNILKLDNNVISDIIQCKYNIHKYNELYRENNKVTDNTNEPFVESLENLKDAVTATITAFREYGI